MTFRTLILRSLRHRWRAHLGVVLGAMVGAAALIGALVVGDSVKESLRERAMLRLGKVADAVTPVDRLFREQLATDLQNLFTNFYRNFHGGEIVAALRVSGLASRTDGSARANAVSIYGVEDRFWGLSPSGQKIKLPPGTVVLNGSLSEQLGVTVGDTIVLRVPKNSAVSREAPISPQSDSSIALRLQVHDVINGARFGDFSLRAGQLPPRNAFLNIGELQRATATTNQANMILSSAWQADLPRTIGRGERFARDVKRRIGLLPADEAELGIVTATGEIAAVNERIPLPLEMLNDPQNIRKVWKLADAELNLRDLAGGIELISPRIFLENSVSNAATHPNSNLVKRAIMRKAAGLGGELDPLVTNSFLMFAGEGILTYLVTQFRAGTNYAPYSMITAAGAPWAPAGLRDDEIVVNQWLADDLQVKPSDSIEVSYFLPESGARLVEATNRFRVHSIVPMTMPWADRTLMPEFPGIEKAERTQDWDAGFPITLKIRDKDEAYWKQWRGTPKAFVTLAAGQRMWGNRFGNLTAIRWPVPTNFVANTSEGRVTRAPESSGANTNQGLSELAPPSASEQFRRAIEANLLANLVPADLGLHFEPVREQALKAAEQSQDFGGLFIGFSFFLIAAALILMSLLFRFGLEQRVTEVGTLLALGFTPKQVRRLFLGEGAALATVGTALGLAGGVGYAWLMIRGLTTIWRDAIASSALGFHVTSSTLVMGAVMSVIVCVATLWLTLSKLGRQPVRELLAGEISSGRDGFHSVPETKTKIGDAVERVPTGVWRRLRLFLTSAATVAMTSLVIALASVGWAVAAGETSNAEVFFSAGSLLLIAGIAFAALLFRRLESRPGRFTLPALGLRGCTRRRNRSLAVVGLLACGSFLIAAIGAFKLDANADAWKRSSGTGGFALLGESTLPVLKDLNTPEGLDFFGLDAAALKNVSFVPMRVRDGDEASCLNLNRAQTPRLLGVNPELLAQRGAFTFAKVTSGLDRRDGWRLLANAERGMGNAGSPSATNAVESIRDPRSAIRIPEVPAIGDLNSILWAMGKKVGDTLDYVDERGQPFKVRLVGAVANSVLQGGLLIDEAEFVRRFPGEAGYRMFLIDAPSNRVSEVSAELSRGLQNLGLEVTPTARRLAQFNAVQNTYLNTFQVLGGLGLLLGSAGLGVVVLRNVLERRNEFGVFQAVGFRQRQLQRLVLGEHGALLLLGLAVGIVSALVAVMPSLLSPAAELPWRSLTATLGGVFAVGLLATWLATRWALRGRLTDALRSE